MAETSHPLRRLERLGAGLLVQQVLNIRDGSELTYNDFGKPLLTRGWPHFNLSHAEKYVVLAVSPVPIGVDIELVCSPVVIPERVFTQEELVWMRAGDIYKRFYLLWTRLESALKAQGCGFGGRAREFGLLAQGNPWYWENTCYDGHIITCAARSPFELNTVFVKLFSFLLQ